MATFDKVREYLVTDPRFDLVVDQRASEEQRTQTLLFENPSF